MEDLFKITTGSLALKEYFKGDFWRKVRDEDYLVSEKWAETFIRDNRDKIIVKSKTERGYSIIMIGRDPVELEVCAPGTSGWDYLKIREQSDIPAGNHLEPTEVGWFKLSHRFRKDSPHFPKTMADITQLRKLGWLNPVATPWAPKRAIYKHSAFYDWFCRREKETLSYNHPNLSVAKDDFFRKDTGVEYLYDHDTIHEAVAVGDRPAYASYLMAGETVKTDYHRFMALTHYQRLLGPLEESYVLALERHQIPNGFKPDPYKSFKIALQKVCTSITSGWFREFAWDHFNEIDALYDVSYVEKFKMAWLAGRIAPYTGK